MDEIDTLELNTSMEKRPETPKASPQILEPDIKVFKGPRDPIKIEEDDVVNRNVLSAKVMSSEAPAPEVSEEMLDNIEIYHPPAPKVERTEEEDPAGAKESQAPIKPDQCATL